MLYIYFFFSIYLSVCLYLYGMCIILFFHLICDNYLPFFFFFFSPLLPSLFFFLSLSVFSFSRLSYYLFLSFFSLIVWCCSPPPPPLLPPPSPPPPHIIILLPHYCYILHLPCLNLPQKVTLAVNFSSIIVNSS